MTYIEDDRGTYILHFKSRQKFLYPSMDSLTWTEKDVTENTIEHLSEPAGTTFQMFYPVSYTNNILATREMAPNEMISNEYGIRFAKSTTATGFSSYIKVNMKDYVRATEDFTFYCRVSLENSNAAFSSIGVTLFSTIEPGTTITSGQPYYRLYLLGSYLYFAFFDGDTYQFEEYKHNLSANCSGLPSTSGRTIVYITMTRRKNVIRMYVNGTKCYESFDVVYLTGSKYCGPLFYNPSSGEIMPVYFGMMPDHTSNTGYTQPVYLNDITLLKGKALWNYWGFSENIPIDFLHGIRTELPPGGKRDIVLVNPTEFRTVFSLHTPEYERGNVLARLHANDSAIPLYDRNPKLYVFESIMYKPFGWDNYTSVYLDCNSAPVTNEKRVNATYLNGDTTASYSYRTDNKKFGTGSLMVNTAEDNSYAFRYGGTSAKSITNLGINTNDFTIEMWFYLMENIENVALFSTTSNTDIDRTFSVYLHNNYLCYDDRIQEAESAKTYIRSKDKLEINKWHHVALSRYSNNIYLYVDGIQVGFTEGYYNIDFSYINSTYFFLEFGHVSQYSNELGQDLGMKNVFIDNIRISKFARYKESFIMQYEAYDLNKVFTKQFEYDQNTTVLLHFEETNLNNEPYANPNYVSNYYKGYYTLSSTDNDKYTYTQDENIIAYGGENAKSIANIGLGTNNFTIEFWVYLLNRKYQGLGSTFHPSISTNCFGLYISNGCLCYDDTILSTTITRRFTSDDLLDEEKWHHISMVRQGAYLLFYIDGIFLGSVSGYSGKNFAISGSYYLYFEIGRVLNKCNTSNTTLYMNDMYIDEFRISNIARYYGYYINTDKFYDISNVIQKNNIIQKKNTRVLVNGITPDSTISKDTKIGNQFINTDNSSAYSITDSLAKSGNVSILLNNTNTAVSYYKEDTDDSGIENVLEIGSGNFTIEFWVYKTKTDRQSLVETVRNDLQLGTFSIYIDMNRLVYDDSLLTYGATRKFVSKTELENEKWYHVAMVRHNDNVYFYINGIREKVLSGYTNINFGRKDSSNLFLNIGSSDTYNNIYKMYINSKNVYIDNFRVSNIARYIEDFILTNYNFDNEVSDYNLNVDDNTTLLLTAQIDDIKDEEKGQSAFINVNNVNLYQLDDSNPKFGTYDYLVSNVIHSFNRDTNTVALVQFKDPSNILKDELGNTWVSSNTNMILTDTNEFSNVITSSDPTENIMIHSVETFGTENFTVEFWAYAPQDSDSGLITGFVMDLVTEEENKQITSLCIDHFNGCNWMYYNLGDIDIETLESAVDDLGKWHHFAFIYNKSTKTCYRYIDGKLKDTHVQEITSGSWNLTISGQYLHEVRISNSIRYNGEFIPSTDPFILDSPVTTYNNNPIFSYGGTAARGLNNLGLTESNFTIEFWINLTTEQDYVALLENYYGSYTNHFALYLDHGYLAYDDTIKNTTLIRRMTDDRRKLELNKWHHIAMVRSMDNLYFYLDGERIVILSGYLGKSFYRYGTGSYYCTLEFGRIVANRSTVNQLMYIDSAHITGFKISNIDRYTDQYITNIYDYDIKNILNTEFEPDDYTKVLIHGGNGKLSDESNSNKEYIKEDNTSTYSNNSSIKRWSTKNSTYLNSSSNPILTYGNYTDASNQLSTYYIGLGINDFTIETWLYLTDSTKNQPIASTSSTDTTNASYNIGSFSLYIASIEDKNYLVYDDSILSTTMTRRFTSTKTLEPNTWHHIAMVRQNNLIYFYIDGKRENVYLSGYTNKNFYYSSSDTSYYFQFYFGASYQYSNSVNTNMYAQGIYFNDFRISSNARYNSGRIYNINNYKFENEFLEPFVYDENTKVLYSGEYVKNIYPPLEDEIGSTSRSLLHFNSNNLYHDEFNNNKWIVHGTPRFSSDITKFNSGLLLTDDSYLSLDNTLVLGGKDFTIDLWAYAKSTKKYSKIFVLCNEFNSSERSFELTLSKDLTNIPYVIMYGYRVEASTAYIDEWVHYAIVYEHDKKNISFYINGNVVGTIIGEIPATVFYENYIGKSHWDDDEYVDCVISEFRITNGIAQWTENFTPPTKPYSREVLSDILNPIPQIISNEKYGNLDNIYEDLTQFYKVSDDISKYENTKAIELKTKWEQPIVSYGNKRNKELRQSIKYLGVGGSDFTIEAWVYFTDTNLRHAIVETFKSTNHTDTFSLYIESAKLVYDDLILNNITTTRRYTSNITMDANKWHHIAMVRHSNELYFYIDGVRNGIVYGYAWHDFSIDSLKRDYLYLNVGSSHTPNNTPKTNIFGNNIYIENFEVSDIAKYTDTYIYSNININEEITKEFEYDCYTKILVRGNKYPITTEFYYNSDYISSDDQTMYSVVETLPKFGPNSMHVNCTNGNYIARWGGTSAKNIANIGIGTGDFTIELWLYLEKGATRKALFCTMYGNYANTFALYLENNHLVYDDRLISTSVGRRFTSTECLNLNTWYHIVMERTNDNLNFYLNGRRIGVVTGYTGKVFSNYSSYYNFLELGRVYQYSNTSNTTFSLSDAYIKDFRVSNIARYDGCEYISGDTHYDINKVAYKALVNDESTKILLTCDEQNISSEEYCAKDYIVTDNTNTYRSNINISRQGVGSFRSYPKFNSIFDMNNMAKYGISSGDFTIEFWFYIKDKNNYSKIALLSSYIPDIYSSGIFSLYLSDRQLHYDDNITSTSLTAKYTTSEELLSNYWYHVALVRNENNLLIYLDGELKCTLTGYSGKNFYVNSNSQRHIMSLGKAPRYTNIYGLNLTGQGVNFDEFRVSNIARYSSTNIDSILKRNITTKHYDPSDSSTISLLHFDNDTITDEYSANTWIATGEPEISTEVYKFGSGSLHLNNNYISSNINMQLGGQDFTVDFWVYIKSISESASIFNIWSAAADKIQIQLLSNSLRAYFNRDAYIGNLNIAYNRWNHIVIVYENDKNLVSIYINGKLFDTNTQIVTRRTYSYVDLGYSRTDNIAGFVGYIDEFRISDGIARWISEFTPPTYAYEYEAKDIPVFTANSFTKDTNTTVLWHTSKTLDVENNATDNSLTDNKLNYTINTNITNANTGTIELNESQNYMVSYGKTNSISNIGIGSNNFTIEFWIYTLTGESKGICETAINYNKPYKITMPNDTYLLNNAGTFGLYLQDNYLVYKDSIKSATNNNVRFKSEHQIESKKWNHIAMTRHGDYIYFYINGIRVGTISGYKGHNFSIDNNKNNLYFILGETSAINTHSDVATNIFMNNTYIDEFRISNKARYIDNYIISDNIIDDIPNVWENTNNLVDVELKSGRVNENSIYFSGVDKQKLYLNHNILYGQKEFTITTWIKKRMNSNSQQNILFEISPKNLSSLNLTLTSANVVKSINEFDNSIKENPGIQIKLYKIGEEYVLNYCINDLILSENVWQYISVSFKNNLFYTFLNGELLSIDSVKSNTNILDYFNDNDNYTIIGNSFLNNVANYDENNFYLDDFVIYDKAVFLSNFSVPDGEIDPDLYSPYLGMFTHTEFNFIPDSIVGTVFSETHLDRDVIARRWPKTKCRLLYIEKVDSIRHFLGFFSLKS